jgi:hypothetical protein
MRVVTKNFSNRVKPKAPRGAAKKFQGKLPVTRKGQ